MRLVKSSIFARHPYQAKARREVMKKILVVLMAIVAVGVSYGAGAVHFPCEVVTQGYTRLSSLTRHSRSATTKTCW